MSNPEKCLACEDFPDAPSCCESCHDDADQYGYDLFGDGVNYRVCCTVAKWLKDKGTDIYPSFRHTPDTARGYQ
jgi:hypothetical protein